MKRTTVVLVVVAVVLAVVAVPYRVVIAPRWHIEVVDANRRPVVGHRVDEIWAYYALQRLADREKRETDAQGEVEFPERTRLVNGLQVLCGAAARMSETGVHASFGIDATVIVWGAGGAVVTKDRAGRKGGMLHSVVVLTDVSVRPTAARFAGARVVGIVQGGPPEASHGKAGEEPSTQVGLAAVDGGRGAGGTGRLG